jgi:hypothetical protein
VVAEAVGYIIGTVTLLGTLVTGKKFFRNFPGVTEVNCEIP